MELYVDANVFISYIKQELGGMYTIQFPRVKELYIKCRDEGHIFILSPKTFEEVEKNGYTSEEELTEFLDDYGIRYRKVNHTPEIKEKSGKIKKERGIHYPDCLHAAYALHYSADCIITWDTDFQPIKGLIEVKTPFEFL
ncbi:MAG: type II toxin-antitoxin system VapC family toxin [Candidatus Altiarchaeota archaeon]|nr:type II toxin-antitoxin system VapC family toxin [Candidatus Altiarchaeota archaeon]